MIAQWDSSLSVLPVARVQFTAAAEYFKGFFPDWSHSVVKKVGCLGNFPEPTGNPYLYVRAGVLDTRHVQPGNVMVQKISAWLAG